MKQREISETTAALQTASNVDHPVGENNSNVGAALPSSRTCLTIIDFRNVPVDVGIQTRRRRGDPAPTATRLPDVISIICPRL